MDLNAPFVNYVIAAYGVAVVVLVGVAVSVVRAYLKAHDKTKI